jgi:ribosomal protein S18 acetylase RimI-like enzyme
MKTLAFLSLSATIRFKSRRRHHCWIVETQRQNHRQLPSLPPTLPLTSTHQHAAVTSRWLRVSSNDEYKSNQIDDDDCYSRSDNEAPSVIRCNAHDSNIHIYQMNAAALQYLFMKEQQTRHDIAGQSCTNDSSEANSGSYSTESSSTSILERILNCTADIDDTSTSMSQYYEPEVYFVAVPTNTEISHDKDNNILLQSTILDLEYATIMGIITIQLRNKSPLIAGPSTPSTQISSTNNNSEVNSNNCDTNSDNDPSSSSSDLPAVTLPTPHFYICNVQVEQQFRQQGIGTSLLQSIVEYCKGYDPVGVKQQENNDDKKKRSVGSNGYIQSSSSSVEKRNTNNNKEQLLQKLRQRQQNRRNKAAAIQHNPSSKSSDEDTTMIPIVLSVDTDNIPAVRLYEKFGFEYLEQNDVFCMMVLRT